jgi:preprotein translocase subunit SecG
VLVLVVVVVVVVLVLVILLHLSLPHTLMSLLVSGRRGSLLRGRDPLKNNNNNNFVRPSRDYYVVSVMVY